MPDFLVVGAPKCGTTALHRYLLEQPGVFVPELKEPNHFSTDVSTRRRLDRGAYLELFAGAPRDEPAGEVSVWNLYSQRAARAVHELCGPIPVVALLRNPLEAIPALHAQFLFNGDEPLALAEALAAEPARMRGEARPAGSWVGPECLCYREVYRYSEQLRRYFEVLGRERVHSVLFDDFVADPAVAFAGILEATGVRQAPAVADFRVVNAHRAPRRRWLRRLFRRHETTLRRWARRALRDPDRRRRWGQRVRSGLRRATGRRVPREPLSEGLWRQLVDEMASEVDQLGELLDRDLSHWLVRPR